VKSQKSYQNFIGQAGTLLHRQTKRDTTEVEEVRMTAFRRARHHSWEDCESLKHKVCGGRCCSSDVCAMEHTLKLLRASVRSSIYYGTPGSVFTPTRLEMSSTSPSPPPHPNIHNTIPVFLVFGAGIHDQIEAIHCTSNTRVIWVDANLLSICQWKRTRVLLTRV